MKNRPIHSREIYESVFRQMYPFLVFRSKKWKMDGKTQLSYVQ